MIGNHSLKAEENKWPYNILQIALNHSQITGILAGIFFSIFAIFLTNTQLLDRNDSHILGLLLAAFYGYVLTSIMFSYNLKFEYKELQYMVFCTASSMYYLSAILSFSALNYILIRLNTQLDYVIGALIIGSLIGGFLAIWFPIHSLYRTDFKIASVILFLPPYIVAILLSILPKPVFTAFILNHGLDALLFIIILQVGIFIFAASTFVVKRIQELVIPLSDKAAVTIVSVVHVVAVITALSILNIDRDMMVNYICPKTTTEVNECEFHMDIYSLIGQPK